MQQDGSIWIKLKRELQNSFGIPKENDKNILFHPDFFRTILVNSSILKVKVGFES